MTEHDLHDPLRRLAETAPAPPPGLASDVVERGRTARRRRLGAVAAAGAAAVAALVVLVPVLGSGSTDRDAEPPVASDTTTPTEPPPRHEPSARMQVVAAGMRELLRENYPSETRLWVRDSVCERWDDFTDDSGKCTDRAAADMAELERLLPTYSIVWVEDDRAPDGARPSGLGEAHPPYVEVAELEDVSEDGGSVFVWAIVGGLNCAGSEYDVTLREAGPPLVKRPAQAQQVIC